MDVIAGTWTVEGRDALAGVTLEHEAARVIVIRCDRGSVDARFEAPGRSFRHFVMQGESVSVLAAAATVEPRGIASAGRYEIHG